MRAYSFRFLLRRLSLDKATSPEDDRSPRLGLVDVAREVTSTATEMRESRRGGARNRRRAGT
jgi:hypothetical protein